MNSCHKMMWKVSILIVYLIPNVLSDCEQFPIHNVDLKKMSGMWYLHYKSSDAKELYPNYKCMRNYYNAHPDGKSADFVEAILPLTGEKTWEGKSFYTTVTKNKNGALHMKIIDPKVGEVDLPSYVLDTDYSSYMITYVCYGDFQGTYIHSRERNPMESDSTSKVEEALKKAKLTIDQFTKTPQDNCP